MSQSDTAACRYHQRSPVRWHCTNCDLALCSDCKPLADQQPDDVPCPLCGTIMVDVDAGPPFWHRWRELLRYPIERTCLVLVASLALVQLVTPSGLPTILAGLPLLPAYLYFALFVFDRSACGIDQPPTFADLIDRKQADTRLEGVLIGLAFAGVICAGALTGWPVVAWTAVLLAFLVLPASIMAFAVDERLQSALALEHFDWIDEGRLFLTGGSHGGFLTNWITTQTDRLTAAVTQRSVSNWISEAGTQAYVPAMMNVEFGGTLWENHDYYWDRSPLKYADRVTTPTLIIHSTDDQITPIGQGQEWFYALINNDVETEFAVFEGEGHGLSRAGTPVNLVKRLELILEWFERHDS